MDTESNHRSSDAPRRWRRLILFRYLAAMVITVGAITGAVLAVNVAVDPLHYFGGNAKLAHATRFDERRQKLYHLLAKRDRYDCLIFGSSRTILLPTHLLEGHNCFNLAFSAGRIGEFLYYAKYLSDRGFRPSLVITGVDDFDFEKVGGWDVPPFVKKGEDPPSPFVVYASLDGLQRSWEAHRDRKPHDWICTIDFDCRIPRPFKTYRPDRRDRSAGPFKSEVAKLYGRLGKYFPDARFVGYVPPISAWRVEDMAREKELKSYLTGLKKASRHFDRFVDFSVVTKMTADPDNTPDGSHYAYWVNRVIAAHVLSGGPGPGLDVKKMSVDRLMAAHLAGLRRFRDKLAAVE